MIGTVSLLLFQYLVSETKKNQRFKRTGSLETKRNRKKHSNMLKKADIARSFVLVDMSNTDRFLARRIPRR